MYCMHPGGSSADPDQSSKFMRSAIATTKRLGAMSAQHARAAHAADAATAQPAVGTGPSLGTSRTAVPVLPVHQATVEAKAAAEAVATAAAAAFAAAAAAAAAAIDPSPVVESPAARHTSRQRRQVAFAITITRDGSVIDGSCVLAYSIIKSHMNSDVDVSFIAFVHPTATKSVEPLKRFGYQ
jgi:hypothetical protein